MQKRKRTQQNEKSIKPASKLSAVGGKCSSTGRVDSDLLQRLAHSALPSHFLEPSLLKILYKYPPKHLANHISTVFSFRKGYFDYRAA